MPGALGWGLVLMILLLAGFAGAIYVKKWARTDDEGTGDNFTLSDLRRLHKAGNMTTEEFEKARQAIVALAQKPPVKPDIKPLVDPRETSD